MKKIYPLVFLLLLLSSKSYSQTQFPFYGYELSNYETGDTLEYRYSSISQSTSNNYTTINIIIDKQTFGNDSIRFTIHQVTNGIYNSNGHGSFYYTNDTIEKTITNDSVYNNDNNITHDSLYRFSWLRFDTTCVPCHPDSAYIKFDSTGGLKRIRLLFHSQWDGTTGYEAIENIGLISDQSNTEYDGDFDWALYLVYAHLAHYGVYGTYNKLIDKVDNPSAPETFAFIYYDNSGNSFLSLSSTQNIPLPQLILYDLLGREVKTIPVNIGDNPIYLNNCPKGMYLYKVTSGGNILGQGKLMNL